MPTRYKQPITLDVWNYRDTQSTEHKLKYQTGAARVIHKMVGVWDVAGRPM
jgi:hypothetical protein